MTGSTATPTTPTTAAPMTIAPMTNESALAYAKAHRDTTIGLMTATNRLAKPICRLVFLSVEHKTPVVNQAGPTSRLRGNLDPSDKPLIAPGDDSLVSFPIVPEPATGPTTMVVTAFGCDRIEKHSGMYVVDQDAVLFQQKIPVKDQGRFVIAKAR